jgi:hypothetical protein
VHVTPAVELDATAPIADAAAEASDAAAEAVDAGTPCERLAAANDARVDAGRAASDAGCPVQGPDVTCVDARGITWGWRVASLKIERNGDNEFYCATTFKLELLRQAADAGATALPPQEAKYDWTTKQDRRSLTALVDYDGDGLDEVLAVHDTHYHEGSPDTEARVYTFKKGAIVPYAPANGIAIEEVEDIDADGRPDFLTRGPYAKVGRSDAFGNDWPVAPAIFAAHSRADGTFAKDDDAARARAHKACPSRPTIALSGDEHDALTLVCARLWGVPAATLVKEIRSICPYDPEAGMTPYETCRLWEESLAGIDPPFRLDKK